MRHVLLLAPLLLRCGEEPEPERRLRWEGTATLRVTEAGLERLGQALGEGLDASGWTGVALRGVPQKELLDRLRQDFEKMQGILRELGPEEWSGLIVPHYYMGPLPAYFFAAGQLMDYAVHSWDIRQGSGRNHALPGEAADLLVPFMFVLWQSTIKQGADLSPFRVGIRVGGVNGGDFRVSVDGDGMTYEPGDLADLPAVIEFDAGSMVLTTFGRCNAGTVRGDLAVAERFLNLFFRI